MNTTEKVAPPIPLCAPGETEPLAFICSVCRSVWTAESGALCCCTCDRCHGLKEKSGSYCKACAPVAEADRHAEWAVKQAAKEAERFAKATMISEADYGDEPVYWEGHVGSYGDDYFANIEEVRDRCTGCKPLPEYVWATAETRMSLSADDAIESVLEQDEHHEDAGDKIGPAARKQLQDFMDAWCAEHPVISYCVDYSRAVILSAASEAA